MRLSRLCLERYGGFTDAVLELPRPPGPADVTVVLGPNEAGKSTAFAAWLDLLFGMKTRNHPATWRHARKDLRVGADLEVDGATRRVVRLPNAPHLTDGEGSPLAQSEMDAWLRGLDRDGYRTRFSLDRGMLEDGGREIAAGDNDLGRLLFAGVEGLTGLTAALDAGRAAVEGFHAKGARKSAVAEARHVLQEADKTLRDRLTPERMRALDAAVAGAAGVRADAKTGLARARREREAERIAETLRDLDRDRADLKTRAAALPRTTWSLPAAEAARAALATWRTAADDLTRAEAALVRAREGEDAAPAPDEGVAQAVIDALSELLVDDEPVLGLLGAAHDIRLRGHETDLAAATDELGELRRRIGARGALPASADALEGVLRTASTRRDEAGAAAREHDEAVAALDAVEAPPDPGDVVALRDAVKARQACDVAGPMAERDALAEKLAGLDPAPAVVDDLPDPDELDAAVDVHADARRAVAAAEDALRAAAERCDAATRTLADRTAAAARTAPAEAERLRRARDDAWRTHRAALDAVSADAFERALDDHDDVVAASAEAQVRAAARDAAAESLAEAEAALERARSARDAAGRDARAADPSDLARRLHLPEGTAPAAFAPRLRTLREIATLTPGLVRAEQALTEAISMRDLADARLAVLVPTADVPLVAAEARLRSVDADAAVRGRHATLSEAVTRTAERHGVAERSAVAAERTRDDALAAAGLPELTLDALSALRDAIVRTGDIAELTERVDGLRRARELAAPHLARLPDLEGDSVIALGTRAEADRVAVADRAQRARVVTEAETTRAEAAGRASRTKTDLEATLDGQGGAGDPTPRVAELSDAAQLADDLRALSRRAEDAARGQDPEALAAARSLPPDPARRPALEDAEAGAQSALETAAIALAAAEDARRAAQGGDAAARAAQERATVLAELSEGMRGAVAALLGHRAAEAAMERLVRERRGPLLDAAEAAFRAMTGGTYEGLRTFGAGGRSLTAHRDGVDTPVDALSEGTRAQLFLSLRVAGHAEFCDGPGPLPFVTDDILEAFDDARAAAALRMAAEMGRRGQVIFLTHHDHVARMAEREIPGVAVIDMPRQG